MPVIKSRGTFESLFFLLNMYFLYNNHGNMQNNENTSYSELTIDRVSGFSDGGIVFSHSCTKYSQIK